jgi:uncharacterized membrane protein
MPPEKPATHGHVMRTLRNNFLTGIVVAAPVAVTIWLVLGFIGIVDRVVKPLIPPIYNPETYLTFAIPGLGLVFAVAFLTGLGAFAANVAGKAALGWGDRLVDRVPIVRTVYRGTKQIINSVMTQRENSFREVVMIQHPREDCWMIGFVTRPASGEVAAALGPDFVAVFVPTTPNPTTGFLIYERRSRLKPLDMSVEDGAKLLVSAGLLTPGQDKPAPPAQT